MKPIATLMLCGALSALCATAGAQTGDAANYPDKPVRIVVPFAPGGASDTITRKIADKLAPRLKQSVIVDNRAGGNTIIASEHVARGPKDGYTIYSTNTTIFQVPMVYPNARYDEEKDFRPLAQCCTAPLALVVRTDSPIKNVKEFIEQMKGRQSNYGTAGAGGTQHILSEAFKRSAGLDAVHIPYKGEAPLMSDFLGGRIDWYIATPITISPHVKTGKVRVLAVTGPDRIPLFPDVPTFKEQGVAKLEAVGWYGLFVPTGTPGPIVDRLSKELVAVLQQPDITQYINENGLVPAVLGTEEFAKTLPPLRETFRSLIKENNIKID
ncbi:MAG TPA: tripartite tricarboxylate transporter substrate binding protein [Noviherbaspirillum sp.]|jgi:tripartite-type tricarboxylate transporter receptor subunit TctC|uniref:Bug family tripartite tricarboxylate transporter substrate binding protein n=1 Tax=Noviherbaspirillum sp. TaxID=1926288 RepID=UPI002DDD0720|nr:tripartite tricarboxylate transporter substrate binding protein [Noviherbaspirillum sp.]HEV2610087.1 tripartite tricarboxylate transporter substrate binding protein [Noviherbaspirillum sp.]